MIRCILIILLLTFYSCNRSAPSEIIKPKKMQEILWDIERADVLAQQLVRNDSGKTLAIETVKLTNQVFSIHHITEEQFKKSYSYYTQHPDIMKIMLDSINNQQSRNRVHTPIKNKPLPDTIK